MLIRMSITNEHHSRAGVMLISIIISDIVIININICIYICMCIYIYIYIHVYVYKLVIAIITNRNHSDPEVMHISNAHSNH